MSPKIIKRQPVICYSRCCGWFSPLTSWNKGKIAEFGDRKEFEINEKDFK